MSLAKPKNKISWRPNKEEKSYVDTKLNDVSYEVELNYFSRIENPRCKEVTSSMDWPIWDC